MKIATGILVLPVRHPVVLAKEISTFCHLSQNRVVFGVGPEWYEREYEVTGSRIDERGRRTDEIIEAVTLLLTRPNASCQGKYDQFKDVTIEPRPPKMSPSGCRGLPGEGPERSRRARHRSHRHGPHRESRALAVARCSGKQQWVKRDWLQRHQRAHEMGKAPKKLTFGRCNFIHLVETASHDKAVAQSKAPFLRAMGTPRSWEHL